MKNDEEFYNFIEQSYNIKLLPYQKILLNMQSKMDNTFYNTRHYTKKLDTYILLVNRALFMKDEETIALVSPKNIKKMNREELFNWLENEYWK